MGVCTLPSTMPGGLTPICSSCGVCLCWDISQEEYDAHPAFWDAWKCEDCNDGVRMQPGGPMPPVLLPRSDLRAGLAFEAAKQSETVCPHTHIFFRGDRAFCRKCKEDLGGYW